MLSPDQIVAALRAFGYRANLEPPHPGIDAIRVVRVLTFLPGEFTTDVKYLVSIDIGDPEGHLILSRLERGKRVEAVYRSMTMMHVLWHLQDRNYLRSGAPSSTSAAGLFNKIFAMIKGPG
jgi:hypothetical protein